MNKKEEIGKLILRIFFGGLMLVHGIPKAMKLINGDFGFADPIGIGSTPTLLLAVLTEVVCALMLIIGFQTRWAAILLLITMLVAAFIVHAGDPWAKMELPLLYACGYLCIAFLGAGKWSIDRR